MIFSKNQDFSLSALIFLETNALFSEEHYSLFFT